MAMSIRVKMMANRRITSELSERQRHRVEETVEDVNLLTTCKNQFDGMTVLLKFQKSLAADAAGRCGFLDKLTTGERGDGYRLHRHTGKFGAGGIQGSALTADAGKSGILLIGTDSHLAVVELQGCSHLEVTIR